MQSERQQRAAEYRAEGAEAAKVVRAKADRERVVILADAQRDAQKVRGDGDAQSISIYAKAFGHDSSSSPSIARCRPIADALTGRKTSFVLTPSGKFFRFFQNPAGTPAAGAAAKAGSP